MVKRTNMSMTGSETRISEVLNYFVPHYDNHFFDVNYSLTRTHMSRSNCGYSLVQKKTSSAGNEKKEKRKKENTSAEKQFDDL